jgi:Zn-dependent protease
MPSARQGSVRLFRFAGIDLFLHWSWFLVAAFEIQNRKGRYSSLTWNVVEYLALFLIVMLHEFGHALACRQVGGTANQIVLWPLGGVAYVDPPPRPGATLWSIAAGPLVNVALLPVLFIVFLQSRSLGWAQTMPDLYRLVQTVLIIDVVLLVFNMLPIYPLDGGQILRSLLWFVFGRARSLDSRFSRRGRVHCSCLLDPFCLERGHRCLHAIELLGWTAARAGAIASR